MSLVNLLGKPHYDYKAYIDNLNIVMEAIEEIAFLSNTLNYDRLVVFFKEIIETFEFFKKIDEDDDNSEGFSNMNNKDSLIANLIDCEEYKNLVDFMETYGKTIIRKCDKLIGKIEDLLKLLENSKDNKYILKDYNGNMSLMNSKMLSINEKLLDNIDTHLPHIKVEKINFNIKLITKNDIICILSSYPILKKFVYKHMHVIDREYYTPTKDDVIEFRNELYKIYEMLCLYFNKNKKNYVEDIHKKFGVVLILVKELEKYGDILAKAREGTIEATKGAMEDNAKEEIDTNIVEAKNTNVEDTGDNGVMAKQLKELAA
jgi:hypothetical protein